MTITIIIITITWYPIEWLQSDPHQKEEAKSNKKQALSNSGMIDYASRRGHYQLCDYLISSNSSLIMNAFIKSCYTIKRKEICLKKELENSQSMIETTLTCKQRKLLSPRSVSQMWLNTIITHMNEYGWQNHRRHTSPPASTTCYKLCK